MRFTTWLSSVAFGLIFLFPVHAPVHAHELGSNMKPLAFGDDQTIIDLNKLVWEPLNVEGLPEGVEHALLRGAFDKDGAEAILRIPPGYKVPVHTHTSDELYIWLSGAFVLIAADGTRTEFAGPTYISFPGNAPPHGLECGEQEPCMFYLKYSRPFDIKYAEQAED